VRPHCDWDLYALKALKAIRESRLLPVVAEQDVDKVNAQRRMRGVDKRSTRPGRTLRTRARS